MNSIIGKLFFLFLLGISNLTVCADGDSLVQKHNSGFKTCLIRPTFFEVSVRTLPSISSFPQDGIGRNANFEQNKQLKIKLNVPILFSKKLSVIGQFRYKNEQLHLGENQLIEENEIHFDNMGMSFLFKYNLKNRKYVAGHVGGFFKADKLSFENYSSILDYNSSFVFGKDIHNGTWAVGAIFGNSLGRFQVYPLLVYEHQWAEKWRLEMRLPKEVQVRRILTPDSFYLRGTASFTGASYFISDEIVENLDDLEFRRSAIELKLGIEKEIFDFIWISADVGVTQPIFSSLVKSGEPTRNKIHELGSNFTPFAGFSLFLVPPRSMFKKNFSK